MSYLSRWLLAAFALAALLAIYQTDRMVFRESNLQLEASMERIRERLAKQDVALLYSADDPPGMDWASGEPVRIAGVMAAPGRFGAALQFDGSRRTFVSLPLKWSNLGQAFTVALWLNLDPSSPDQEILFTRASNAMGLKLDRGQLAFFSTATNPVQAAAYAFTNYGRFAHIAAVVESGVGRIRIYEDGALKADFKGEPFEPLRSAMHIGAANDALIAEPVKGAVDDLVIWRRALSAADVADLARAPKPVLARVAGREVASMRRIERLRAGYSSFLKLIDRFNPALYATSVRRAPLPEVSLILSKKDLRHFVKADRQCRRSGRRTEEAAEPRRIDILDGEGAFSGKLRLDGSDHAYPASARRSYVLEPQEGKTVLGLRRIHLQPPETAGWLDPLLETRVARELNFPTVSNGLCRLIINGEFAGIYYFEDYARLAVPPGEQANRFQGAAPRTAWRLLDTPLGPRMDRQHLIEICDETYRAYRQWLRADYTSPLSAREIYFQVRADKNRLKTWPLDESERASPAVESLAVLSPWLVIGTNPSPDFILHDLALPEQLPDGAALIWTSSNPDLISQTGRVFRPTNNTPAGVTLTARLADSPAGAGPRVMNFRVMPRHRAIPAVFLWTADPPARLSRVDCAMEYYPAGDGDAAHHSYAAQHERAGISLRGRTSLRQRKRPFSLRLSEPHGWWGSTNETKIRFVNPWRDLTFLHNWFFYSRFASFADAPGRVRIGPPVTWVEAFINGSYFGLYETSPAIRSGWLGFPEFEDSASEPAVLYKSQDHPPSLSPDAKYLMRQLEPSRRHGEFREPEIELQRLIMEAAGDVFVKEISERLDLDNLADFHLLLEFSENYNGFPFNYAIHDLLARPPGPRSKFFLIPYDFDNVYGDVRYPFYHSIVFTRLLQEYPGYAGRLAGRWRELRHGPLDLDAMERDIRAQAEQLAPYVAWNDQRWSRDPGLTFSGRVEEFIGHIRRRVKELDARFAAQKGSDAQR